MWHEARRQERKIRVMMVDYQRRADRRRQFYEQIVSTATVSVHCTLWHKVNLIQSTNFNILRLFSCIFFVHLLPEISAYSCSLLFHVGQAAIKLPSAEGIMELSLHGG